MVSGNKQNICQKPEQRATEEQHQTRRSDTVDTCSVVYLSGPSLELADLPSHVDSILLCNSSDLWSGVRSAKAAMCEHT